jgi:hypothetical protein
LSPFVLQVKVIPVVGNHDVGFHQSLDVNAKHGMSQEKIGRFERDFGMWKKRCSRLVKAVLTSVGFLSFSPFHMTRMLSRPQHEARAIGKDRLRACQFYGL